MGVPFSLSILGVPIKGTVDMPAEKAEALFKGERNVYTVRIPSRRANGTLQPAWHAIKTLGEEVAKLDAQAEVFTVNEQAYNWSTGDRFALVEIRFSDPANETRKIVAAISKARSDLGMDPWAYARTRAFDSLS